MVLPASARGVALTERIVSQSSPGVPGTSEGDHPDVEGAGDLFGAALASADFDRDGYADLAVGQPGENEGVGAVTVIYGSFRGPDTNRSRRVNPTSGSGAFGAALVAGDFDRDQFPDLGIGAPSADVEGDHHEPDASGSVTVLPGGATGLSTADPVVVRRRGGVDGDIRFGSALAAGDLDRDGGTDLIIYAPGNHDLVDYSRPGSLTYCPNQVDGPSACSRLVRGLSYAGGGSLVVGNTSGDSRPEIIFSSPNYAEDEEEGGAGEVHVLHLGDEMPARVVGQNVLTQNSRGVPGSDEYGDGFGSSIALGDVDRDGYADLVIGAAYENDGEGRVTVVHGAQLGWRTSGNYFYSQNTRGIPGVAEGYDADLVLGGDLFGSEVSLRDHNGDGRLDLTVGAPEENSSGAITTLLGSRRGFTTAGARAFGLATLGYAHRAEAEFGATLGNN
ncbi:FG-GAP repeat-containing protein [Friedmanniella luteola]|uniref:FG-GAP repeat-containing protein n=1 Tax=Friedmanniella luteola TaxID=546871 RepID=A0A1H1SZ83_9ACTN|nr:FG-GAP repeat-containing protein [Friedmanniella luteola]